MHNYIFILLILFMSCATNPIDKHDDNVILQSLIKIADIGKIMSYDLDSSRTVDCIELPDTICLWQDGRITQLNLYNMGLSGPIPENIGNLDKLVTLGLSSNELIGGIPESIGNLSELTQLSLDSNHLSGNIPESIGNIKKLNWLRLVNNQFSGSIPDTIGSLPALRGLLINGNQFNLEITNNICNIYNNLDTINVTGNQFCPPFPSCIDYPNIIGKQDCQGLECKEGLTEINHYCYLDSDLDVLQSLIDNSPSDSLNMIMDVDTSGTIEPLELGKQEWHSGKLETLDCYWGNTDSTSCNLSQSIPEFISDLKDLTTLDLQQNNISGNLPEKLGDMDKLTSLNLSSNQLIDYIPEEICKIYSAENYINLGDNFLCPCYPQCITETFNTFGTTQETSECAYCDEGYTQFCENVPYRDEFILFGFDYAEPAKIDSICFKENHLNVLQSFIDNSNEGNSSSLDMIMDVDSSGIIEPLELGAQLWKNGNLIQLITNNVGLSGEIPDNIEDLDSLQMLYLCNNQLSGVISNNICNLPLNFTDEHLFRIYDNNLCLPYPACIQGIIGEQNDNNCQNNNE